MLTAFVDDSGSGGDSPWYVLAGYVGTDEAWGKFDDLWLSAMREGRAIQYFKYFKSAEAESLREQFAGFSVTERNAKIDSLIGVIEKCAHWSIGDRVRQAHYDELIKGRIPKRWDSPYWLLFYILIGSTNILKEQQRNTGPIKFVFDSNERFERTSDVMVKTFYDRGFFKDIVDVSYCDDKKSASIAGSRFVCMASKKGVFCNRRAKAEPLH